jgi:hypothetical protein
MRLPYQGPIFYLLAPFLFIFFVVPYIFDVAYCEDLYGTPLSQAALIDGEKVDPYEAGLSVTSFDFVAASNIRESLFSKFVTRTPFLPSYSQSAQIPVLRFSRPPPPF